tara:strand:- start:246 stop:350 length:105 start_codon:yes stop_codon:yes gene_type:complete
MRYENESSSSLEERPKSDENTKGAPKNLNDIGLE